MGADRNGRTSVQPAEASKVAVEEVMIDSESHQLSGKLHLPRDSVQRAIVVHSATGVPQHYYEAFARWLAVRRHAAVLTYDYRDFGLSATFPVRDSSTNMTDWGVCDQSAALDHLCERFPGMSIEVVGHSLGGQYLSFHANVARVSRLVAIASGPAYWLGHPIRFFPQVLFFWFVGGPAATVLAGYFPGRLIGLGADLPRNVYWQWRRWCLSADYNRRDWGVTLPRPDLNAFRGELVLVGIEDDKLVPPARVRMLSGMYPAARIRYVHVRPGEFDMKQIGHVKLLGARCSRIWQTLFDGDEAPYLGAACAASLPRPAPLW